MKGGSMKGHSSSGNRGKQYGLMLVVAFGLAIFGVMILHKLRERRIFNLLLKQKDRDLFSLHLLLQQKERHYNNEAKKKTQEMKAQIYSLDSRILEMQSTISSLKDEQKTMESALEEKQNEIKFLREKEIETDKEDPRVIALTETLKQKEAEIEDLKHRLEYPIKVWSVSTDDPSKLPVNLTETPSMVVRDKLEASSMKEVSEGLHESTGYRNFENSSKGVDESLNESTTYGGGDGSTRGEDRREDRVESTGTRETTGEHSQKLQNSQDEVFRDGILGGEKSANEIEPKKMKDSQDGEGLGIDKEENNGNATETIANHSDVLKTKDENGDPEMTDGKEHGTARIEETENLNSQEGGMNSRGGIKMEMPDNSQAGADYTARGKQRITSKLKGKRWRIFARNRRNGSSMNAKNDEDVSIKSRRFRKDALQSERYKRLRDDELQKLDRRRGNHNMGLETKDKSSQMNDKPEAYDKDSWKDVQVNSLKPQNSEDAENESSKGRNTDINHQIEKGQEEVIVPHESFEKPNGNPDDMRTNKTVDSEVNQTAGDANEKNSDELRQSEEHAGGVEQQIETRDGDKVDQNSEEVKVADKHEEQEDLEVAETQEAETDFRESIAKLEEDKEESGEETDETEF